MKIIQVIPQENHLLFITTDTGQTGFFDVSPYLNSEAFLQLKDRQEFESISNGGYFIEWRCGADLSADTILAKLQPVTNYVQR